MKLNVKSLNFYFIAFLLCIALLPFILITIYANPAADDFCFNTLSSDLGYWEANIFAFSKWNGRYFASSILLLPIFVKTSLFTYKLMPLILIAGLTASIIRFVSYYLDIVNIKTKLILSALIIIAYFLNIPSVAEGFYWLSGSISYQLPLIFLLNLLISWSIFLEFGCKKQLFAIILLTLAIIGSNETIMIILDGLLLLICIHQFSLKSVSKGRIITLCLIALLPTLFVIMAPGNFNRSLNFPNGGNVIFSVVSSIQMTFLVVIKWLPHLIIANLIFISLISTKNFKGIRVQVFDVPLFLQLVGIGYLISSALFPSFYGLGQSPPLRVLNIIYFLIIISTFYFAISIQLKLLSSNTGYISLSHLSCTFLLCCIFLSLNSNNPIKNAYSELWTGEAKNYNDELETRYGIINSTNGKTLSVEKLRFKPSTIYVGDITNDSIDWRNQCYSNYFDLSAIKVD